MTLKSVENVPSIGILAIQQLSSDLEEKLPDCRSVLIEPSKALCEDDLPAAVIYIGEEDVQEVKECQTHNMEIVDGKMASPCCDYSYVMRQNFYVEVVVEQCHGAYAEAERIMNMVKQLMIGSGIPGLFYASKNNTRSDERSDSTTYAISARGFIDYCYPEERE